MSLESDIQELTVAVRALTHALAEHRAIASATCAVIDPQAAYEAVKHEQNASMRLTADQQKDVEKYEAGNEKSKPTTDTSPPSSNESRTVTYDDVKNITIAVSKIDKAKAVAGLARFGVATAKALEEKQWLDYVVYMERVQKGEIDPESSHE